MTDTNGRPSAGEEYVVLYLGGPNDGQTDKRIASSSGWDDELASYIAVDATETLVRYRYESARQVGDAFHVSYRYAPGEGDPLEDLDDRGEF